MPELIRREWGGGSETLHVLRYATADDSCPGPRRLTRLCIQIGYSSAQGIKIRYISARCIEMG